MKEFFINLGLAIVAVILSIILVPIGLCFSLIVLVIDLVKLKFSVKGFSKFYRALALSIDQLGGVILGPLFNAILITKDGYKFGDEDDTISYALGRNLELGTLTRRGRWLQVTLDNIDKDHCKKAVELAIIKGQKFCNIN